MVQALMGQSSATHQLFCKSASAAGRAGAAYTRAASLSRMPDWTFVQAFADEYKTAADTSLVRLRPFCYSGKKYDTGT